MKQIIIGVIAFLALTFSYAQQGVNYKAVVRNADGNLLVNDSITVKFKIQKLEAETYSDVYIENHDTRTNRNGLVSLIIGTGVPVITIGGSTLSSIDQMDWANGQYFLNVQLNTDGEFIDIGTSGFNYVPYAYYAKEAGNVNGLGVLEEGNGQGWRLLGKDAENYGAIGENAVDFSTADLGTTGAISNGSVAFGYNTTAGHELYTSNYASAFGNSTVASGTNSAAFGQNTSATITNATAFGQNTQALGINSMALGYNATATAYGSLVIGRNNIGSGNSIAWNANDPVFEIGVGTINTPSNALTVLKNGNVGIGSAMPQSSLTVIKSNPGNVVNIESQSLQANQGVLELNMDTNTTNEAQFIKMHKGEDEVASIDSYGRGNFHSIKFNDNSVQTTAAINPIAYGRVKANGTIGSGSGNFSVVWNDVDEWYEITIDGHYYYQNSYTVLITGYSPYTYMHVMIDSNDPDDESFPDLPDDGKLRVKSNSEIIPFGNFSFLVY